MDTDKMSSDFDKLLEISVNESPKRLVSKIGFQKSLEIARSMLINREWDASLQEYCVKVLEETKRKFPKEWVSDWKYEAFLGYAYDITLKYEERYNSYKEALCLAKIAPPQLLVALAGCEASPGSPPVSIDEAIGLLKQAVSEVPYPEAVDFLSNLYRYQGNEAQALYWREIFEENQGKGVQLPTLDKID